MSDDILVKFLENLVSFMRKNPFFSLVLFIIILISIYGIYKIRKDYL